MKTEPASLFCCTRTLACCAAAFAMLALEPALSRGAAPAPAAQTASPRQRISINDNWRFTKGDPAESTTSLLYDIRPAGGRGGRRGAAPDPAPAGPPPPDTIKKWILPSGNDFLADPAKRAARPETNPPENLPYTQATFNDSAWQQLDLPHDFAIEGPFSTAGGGGTGRLPFSGIAWYRKKLDIPAADAGKEIFLDIDGAMAYATVFCNGKLVGGWPYGYASFRLDLTPFLKPGGDNQLAIRLDNPPNSSRWYPGGGIYRNVWLTKTNPVHIAQWGTYITTDEVSEAGARITLRHTIDRPTTENGNIGVRVEFFSLDSANQRVPLRGTVGKTVFESPNVVQDPNGFTASKILHGSGSASTFEHNIVLENPALWSPNSPNRYVAVSTVTLDGKPVDTYETPFGIRTLKFDPNTGFSINGVVTKLNGVCDHHDLGSLGTALNLRALQRQLEMLKEMGCNAIRTSHNPPAPELLDMCDQMGFLVMDETFDTWQHAKTPLDYHLLFADWHEQDARAEMRRDRNHPSIIMWSIGNEIGEQGDGEAGAVIARELAKIAHEEDPTRPTTSAMNSASPGSPFAAAIDALGMNYQGSRPSRQQPYGNYPAFHQSFPDKFIYGSETTSTISTRGEYTFPVVPSPGAIAGAGRNGAPAIGEDVANRQMSSYDLYYPSWATSPDTEFAAQDRFPYVGGEFVWTGWDYIGEPTPFDQSRSSYFGIIDLAGFKKDRFYLYQSKWRPDLPMAHLLPHWNWPERVGLKDANGNPVPTPVHLYTSGDEAELFLNGKSLGRKKKAEFEYRLRWDDVIYEPGELKAVAYKNGKEWATDIMKTAGPAAKLTLKPDRTTITADGHDLSFITLTVTDSAGLMVPRTHTPISFSISGPGEIVSTDNGDPTDMTPFPSHKRRAFNGLALVIIKAQRGQTGTITITAKSEGMPDARTEVQTK